MDIRELLDRAVEAAERGKATDDVDLRARWFYVAEAWAEVARQRRQNDNPNTVPTKQKKPGFPEALSPRSCRAKNA